VVAVVTIPQAYPCVIAIEGFIGLPIFTLKEDLGVKEVSIETGIQVKVGIILELRSHLYFLYKISNVIGLVNTQKVIENIIVRPGGQILGCAIGNEVGICPLAAHELGGPGCLQSLIEVGDSDDFVLKQEQEGGKPKFPEVVFSHFSDIVPNLLVLHLPTELSFVQVRADLAQDYPTREIRGNQECPGDIEASIGLDGMKVPRVTESLRITVSLVQVLDLTFLLKQIEHLERRVVHHLLDVKASCHPHCIGVAVGIRGYSLPYPG